MLIQLGHVINGLGSCQIAHASQSWPRSWTVHHGGAMSRMEDRAMLMLLAPVVYQLLDLVAEHIHLG